ncbi:jg21008 [Pararge aegeria aegeria]|uniref:Jg21008 protein n=1 Tax=Pararge aegeria aegeria TaxID=348720 RepID=A0A8S4QCP1_9NEOP|nr:jg21008 [Pararge aegeria aegeria]
MKTSILFNLSVIVLATLVNAKPKPCRTGAFGMTWCGKSWLEYFGGDNENEYGNGVQESDNNKSIYNNDGSYSGVNSKSEANNSTVCNRCIVYNIGNGQNNTNKVEFHENKNNRFPPQRYRRRRTRLNYHYDEYYYYDNNYY